MYELSAAKGALVQVLFDGDVGMKIAAGHRQKSAHEA